MHLFDAVLEQGLCLSLYSGLEDVLYDLNLLCFMKLLGCLQEEVHYSSYDMRAAFIEVVRRLPSLCFDFCREML